jgi:hypothetical protein
MSRQVHQTERQNATQQLLNGPLKNVRAAALAAALVPLASLAATPAEAQQLCQSAGTLCGMVWNDTNQNGVQDAGETGIPGVKVFLYDGEETIETETGTDGVYSFFVPEGTYTVFVQIPPNMQPTAPNSGGDDAVDSDGEPDGLGNSVAPNVVLTSVPPFAPDNPNTDFGLVPVPVSAPGTGTPGYWKNHPEAWPVSSITVGGVNYTLDQAISWLQRAGKDKTTTMFSSLVPAMLNVMVGNDDSCVASTIAAAQSWMAAYGPVGSGVAASSEAWATGEPIHRHLDDYNNGRLCAPHR